jgi:hypothetical protein
MTNAVPVRRDTGCNIQEPQGKDMREPRGQTVSQMFAPCSNQETRSDGNLSGFLDYLAVHKR